MQSLRRIFIKGTGEAWGFPRKRDVVREGEVSKSSGISLPEMNQPMQMPLDGSISILLSDKQNPAVTYHLVKAGAD